MSNRISEYIFLICRDVKFKLQLEMEEIMKVFLKQFLQM